MSHVTVKFLLTDITYEVQLLDQGIIWAAKSRCHQHTLQHNVTVAETNSTKFV